MESKHFEENVSRWIYHFEKQAKIGLSSRSFFNNRIIVVQKLKKDKQESGSVSKVIREEGKKNIPDIVSPVQQVVEQAEEEIRRGHSEKEGGNNINLKDNNLIKKRKRTVKGRFLNSKKIKDIFS
jgi:hypothetical protein